MRIRRIVVPMLLVALGCTDDYRGRIEGQVRAIEESIFGEGTPVPVVDMRVEARSLKNGRTVETYSDSQGYYYLTDVQFGLNELTADKDSYEAITKYADVEKDQTTELNILTHKIPTTESINLTFIITDLNLGPLENAVVDLFAITRGEYDYTDRAYEYIATAWTDSTGHAVFMGVASVAEFHINEYRATASAYGYYDASKDFALTFDNPNREFTIRLEPIGD